MQSFKYFIFWITLIFTFIGCSSKPSSWVKYHYSVKDNKPRSWVSKNERVQKFRKKYARSRHVSVALKKGQKYLPYIRKVFRKYKLPPQLAYLPLLESGFDPKAKSPTGARGLWQFTKATAKDYGLRVGWLRDDRLNWRKSTVAAAKYLSALGKRYNYNWELALAAYNGGPGYISRKMKSQGTWNFWELSLRRETAEYVPKFIAMLQIAKEKYNHLIKRDFQYWLASNA